MSAIFRGLGCVARVGLLGALLIPNRAPAREPKAMDSAVPPSAKSPAGEAPKQIGHWESTELMAPRVLALSPDGTILATGGMNGGLYLWDVAKGKPKHILEEAPALPNPATGNFNVQAMLPHDYAMTFSGSGTKLAVFDSRIVPPPRPGVVYNQPPELHLRIWDVPSGKVAREIKTPTWQQVPSTYSCGLTLSPDGERLAMVLFGRKSALTLWNTADGRVAATFPGSVWCLFRPDGKALMTTALDGSIVTYDLPKKQKHVFLDKKKAAGIGCGWMGFTPDGKTLVTLRDVWDGKGNKMTRSNFGKVRVDFWSAESHHAKQPSITLDQYEMHGNVPGRAIASDSATVALATGPRTINIFNAVTGKMRTSVRSAYDIDFICLSRSGRFLAAVAVFNGSNGSTFTVWDVSRPGPIITPSPGELNEHMPGLNMPGPHMPGSGGAF